LSLVATMRKIAVILILLLLISAVVDGRKRGMRVRNRGGRRWGKKRRGGKKGKRGQKAAARNAPKLLSGNIDVVAPKFETVNDAYDNLLGIRLVTEGSCDLLGAFTATFFFTPFQGQELFDGTCTIEDAAGNIINAAFFDAQIHSPVEGELSRQIPIDAHILGGLGIWEGYTGKLQLQGTITSTEPNRMGPTRFVMTGTMMKMPKKVKNQRLKLLGVPRSIPFDGVVELPDVSRALEKKSIAEMKGEPEALIEPESETEAYAGGDVPIEESPEKEEVVNISKLEGFGTVEKLGRFNLSLILQSFEIGMPFDGTLMMSMLDSGKETEHAIRGQFSKANMLLTDSGDYRLHILCTIIGGYGDYHEAKGALLLDGRVRVGNDGGMTVGNLSLGGDMITGAMVDAWEQREHQETLRGSGN